MRIKLGALALLVSIHYPALAADEPVVSSKAEGPPLNSKAEERPLNSNAEQPLPNSAGERTLGEIIDDAAINTKIKAALIADQAVQGLRIHADVLDGKVTLTGTAETREQIQKAEVIASQVSGVRSVDNRIALRSGDASLRVTVRTQIDEPAQSSGTRTAGEFIDDAWINAKVKVAFMSDEQVPGLQINVDTMNKVVTLRGQLDSRARAVRAVELAASIKGVRSVDDQLQVSGATEGVAGRPASPLASDSAINEKVKAALTANSEMKKVDVDTLNGVVTLRGEVTEMDHAAKAAEIALVTEGVESVSNQLAVKH